MKLTAPEEVVEPTETVDFVLEGDTGVFVALLDVMLCGGGAILTLLEAGLEDRDVPLL